MTLELARAIREGSTRPTMGMLFVASLFQGIQLLVLDPIIARPKRVTLEHIADPDLWAYAHLLAAALLLWRLWDKTSRPFWAWACNSFSCALWLMTFLAPAVLLGDTTTLASPLVVIPLAAMWVLMRTEATSRDRSQA